MGRTRSVLTRVNRGAYRLDNATLKLSNVGTMVEGGTDDNEEELEGELYINLMRVMK